MGIAISDIVLGTTFLIIGAYASYYFSNRRRVSWIYTRRRVLDPVRSKYPEGLDILFEGRKIENLVEWKFAIWNDGNVGIKAEDFLEEPQVAIQFPTEKVLRVADPVRSRDVIAGQIISSGSCVQISAMRVLDKSDWLVFDVYTSSEDNETELRDNQPEISANIMHLPSGIVKSKNSFFGSWKKKIFPATAAIGYAVMSYSSAKKILIEFSGIRDGDVYKDISSLIPDQYAIILSYGSLALFSLFSILFAIFALFMIWVIISSYIGAPPSAVQKMIKHNNWPVVSMRLRRILE